MLVGNFVSCAKCVYWYWLRAGGKHGFRVSDLRRWGYMQAAGLMEMFPFSRRPRGMYLAPK